MGRYRRAVEYVALGDTDLGYDRGYGYLAFEILGKNTLTKACWTHL